VGIVALVGLFAIHEPKETIMGEVDASEYRVSNKVPGRIDSLYVKEGDRVKAGDTLAHISSPQVEAKMMQAEAVKNAASAQSRKAKGGAREQQKQMAYQVWQKAKAAVEVYRKSYDRVKGLYEKGVVSAQKFDEVEAQYKVAQANVKAAKSQYDMALKGAQEEDKAAARALVARVDGVIDEINIAKAERYLTSPVDGEVSECFPHVGELVVQGSPVMAVVDTKDMWFHFAIREDMLKDITMGSELQIRVPALGEETYPVKVTFIKVMASYATWRSTQTNGGYDIKTFDVKARPLTEIPNLRPGMTAVVVR
jgi:HlyD family secretion protein